MHPGLFFGNLPWWVWPLLAFLVWRGWQASKSRAVSLRAIFVGPSIFIGWGLASLLTRASTVPVLMLVWFAAAAVGLWLALSTVRLALQSDRARRIVQLPGSWWPLARYLAIFVAKFVLTAWASIQPEMRHALAFAGVGVSGLSAGYFIGWLVCVWRDYRRAPAIVSVDPFHSPQAVPNNS